jgi:hypothetical protein
MYTSRTNKGNERHERHIRHECHLIPVGLVQTMTLMNLLWLPPRDRVTVPILSGEIPRRGSGPLFL